MAGSCKATLAHNPERGLQTCPPPKRTEPMIEVSTQMFFIFLAAGVLLLGAELFIPGGFIGAVGCLCLIAAIVMGFKAFPQHGATIAVGIFFMGIASIVIWMAVFPKTRYGQKLSISRELSDAKATAPGLQNLLGKEGVALSSLRPGGYAEIEGRRVDVITKGEMLDKDTPLFVVQVEGNRVVVAHRSERTV